MSMLSKYLRAVEAPANYYSLLLIDTNNVLSGMSNYQRFRYFQFKAGSERDRQREQIVPMLGETHLLEESTRRVSAHTRTHGTFWWWDDGDGSISTVTSSETPAIPHQVTKRAAGPNNGKQPLALCCYLALSASFADCVWFWFELCSPLFRCWHYGRSLIYVSKK